MLSGGKLKYYFQVWIKHDLFAGLSVFLVALPLCMGIALASGAPVYAGLISGIIGGLVVSFISGSQLGVSGPAAGLSTIVAGSIVSLGDYRVFLLTVMIAGLFQLLLGLLKWGTIVSYFPSSVIKGMLAAIGLILIRNQIPISLGYEQSDFWSKVFSFFSDNQSGISMKFTNGAILITAVSLFIFILFGLPYFKRKSIRLPLALVIVLLGTILSGLFNTNSIFALNAENMIHVPADIFSTIQFPDFSKLFSSVDIWKSGLLIGVIASIESLLSTEAIDKLDKHNRITPIDRELIAQGIGNITCGLLGAIPITSVIVRGSANIDAGGKTKMSSITHGIFLLVAIITIPFLLNKIPLASLACILIITGYNLTRPGLYKNIWRLGWNQFIPFVLTIFGILSTDLLLGVGIGLILSMYFIIHNNFKADYKLTVTKNLGISTYYIKLNTNVTFLNKVKLKKVLDQIPAYSSLAIDGSECNFIDYDVLEIISAFDIKAHERHIELQLKGIEKIKIISVH